MACPTSQTLSESQQYAQVRGCDEHGKENRTRQMPPMQATRSGMFSAFGGINPLRS